MSENLHTSQAESHSFNVMFAEKYGVLEAILISHFQYWINHNKRLGKNYIDGRTWSYQTRREISAWFPYLTEKQVRTVTDNLVKKGVLVKGNYNKVGFDKTIWYAFKNEKMFTIAQMGKGIAQMGRPIPDTKPYAKRNNKQADKPPVEKDSPKGESVVVFSCLRDKDIKDREKLWISKRYSEDEVKKAIAFIEHADTEIKTSFIQCLKWALKEKPQRVEPQDPNENKYFSAKKILPQGNHPDWKIEVTEEHVSFSQIIAKHRDAEGNIYSINTADPVAFKYTERGFKTKVEKFISNNIPDLHEKIYPK
jgi:hypothetical protein